MIRTEFVYAVAITMNATKSSTTATVRMNARKLCGNCRPTSASIPSANAVSVDIAVPQPLAEALPALIARKIAIGIAIPPTAAAAGSASLRRSRSSPRSNSRRASSPTTRKKKDISPLLIHWCRVCETPPPPIRMLITVPHTR